MSSTRPRATAVWSLFVGVMLIVVAMSGLGLAVTFGSQPGEPDYGVEKVLLALTCVAAVVAALHVGFARRGWRPSESRREAVLRVPAVACPALVVAAGLSGFVSSDAPYLLVGLGATFVPHVGAWLRVRGQRNRLDRPGRPPAASSP